MTPRKRAATIAVAMLMLGVFAPAASARSCVAQGVEFERSVFGTGFGQFVSELAHDPEQVGFANLGGFVSFLATSPHDSCPE